MKMKALSLKQPFAELILLGRKKIELRTWNTKFRGEFLIHASAKPDSEAMKRFGFDSLHCGVIVGKAKLIDVKKHAVYGAWIRNGDEIVTEPAIDSRITVPSFLDGSYEISIDFTKHTGSESVSIMLPIQTTSCVFYLDAWGGTVHGLAFVDGKYPDIWPENHELAKVFKIHDNQRYRWDIQVTIEQDAVTIAAQLDRKQLLSWNGKIDRLSIPIPTAMPNRNALGLGAFQGRCTFHRVELRFSDLSTTRLVPYNVDIEENSNK